MSNMKNPEVDDIPCRTVRLIDPPEETKGEFVSLRWGVFNALHEAAPRSPRDFAVLASVVNACRVCKTRTINLSPRWYRRLSVSGRTVRRCLDRLERWGLLAQVKQRGKSPEVTLSDHVPVELGSNRAERSNSR